MKLVLSKVWLAVFTSLISSSLFDAPNAADAYFIGTGIGDITGPVTEINLMGYADLSQVGTGLHMREFSRAYIVASSATAGATDRILFINSDIAMGDTGVRRSILKGLASAYPDGRYVENNVAFVGTHQHSGVGGYLENLLPQITSLGYVKQTADAIVTGTLAAVKKAEASLTEGTLSYGTTEVLNANINRSPTAYLANPAAERARYKYDQDKDMSLLKFADKSGRALGFLSFFAVHGTSIYQNNTLVSTDNKGMAAYLYESSVESSTAPGNTSFVAGFVQANVGDTSPNTEGAYCYAPGKDYDGQPCEADHSTCGGSATECHGRGPAFRISDFASNEIIGRKQFEGAQTLMGQSLTPVSGNVRGIHVFLKMANHTFTLDNGTSVSTCPAAMGYAFAGGTTDGPGTFGFTQGDNTSDPQNPFWEIVKGAVTPAPSAAQKACQDPKPILLNTGYATFPYRWTPDTVDIQILRVGQFVMAIVPGELTTMAGRRLREAIKASLVSQNIIGNDAYVVVAGPANTYAHYITTKEEYGVQRYEGASTIFGQWTLDAYIKRYSELLPYIGDVVPTTAPTSDAAPSDLSGSAISLTTGVVFDAAPIGKKFGQVSTDVSATYAVGQKASASFVGANPRNNLRLGGTFLTVDKLGSNNQWSTYRTDSHPDTVYRWVRDSTILGTSTVTLEWTIPTDTPAGTYRFTYYGDSKPLIGSISAFTGSSGSFTVTK
ncbi:ceramidase [Flagelloscypha sp. PMI_526]|nr:ceramidase [Flagelloscypha sp. PMI_526]